MIVAFYAKWYSSRLAWYYFRLVGRKASYNKVVMYVMYFAWYSTLIWNIACFNTWNNLCIPTPYYCPRAVGNAFLRVYLLARSRNSRRVRLSSRHTSLVISFNSVNWWSLLYDFLLYNNNRVRRHVVLMVRCWLVFGLCFIAS